MEVQCKRATTLQSLEKYRGIIVVCYLPMVYVCTHLCYIICASIYADRW